MRTFLLCDSAEHADIVDQFIMERLRDVDNARGSRWSGVFTDGTRFGVLWASPASELFGMPEEDPSIVLADEVLDQNGESDWAEVVPVEAEEISQ